MDSEKLKRSEKNLNDSKLSAENVAFTGDQARLSLRNNEQPGIVEAQTKLAAEEQELASIYCQQAQFLTLRNRFLESIDVCQQVISLNPQIVRAYLILGDNFYGLSQFSEATEAYHRALELAPESTEIYIRLGQIAYEQQQWHQAINYYLSALAIEPKSLKIHRQLRQVYKTTNQTNLMLECWYQTLILEPAATAQQYYELAQQAFEQERAELAIISCQKSLGLESNFLPSYELLGKLCTGEQKELALITYQELLAQYSDYPEPYFYLAQALYRDRAWSETIEYYRQALAIDPDYQEVYYYFGEALIRAEQWQEAIAILSKAIELDSDYSWSHHHLGVAQFELENWNLAQQSLESAVELNPEFSWSYFNLAEALARQNLLADAERVYQQFLKLEPDFAYGYQRLGELISQQIMFDNEPDSARVKAALNAYQNAAKLEPDQLETYYKALRLEPKSETWCRQLARTYVRTKSPVNAVIFYQILLHNYPKNAQDHFELATVLEQQSNLNAALKHYQHAVAIQPNNQEYLISFKQAQLKEQNL